MTRGGLRLVAYDRTDDARVVIPRIVRQRDGTAAGTGGLSKFWRLGCTYHEALLRRADASTGADSWERAFGFAIAQAERAQRAIAELQCWGHGGFGFMLMQQEPLSTESLGGAHASLVSRLREHLRPDSLVWLRCCSAFGSEAGKRFAETLSRALRCRVAGHTHIIGFFQSGLHVVDPDGGADWSDAEGVLIGDTGEPLGAQTSSARAPRTITALRPGLPTWALPEPPRPA